jgi:hypothetical protein
VFHYAVTAPAWTNPLVIGLAVCGMAGRHWRVACWAWVPILLLSLLPHKEARYLVPSLSFVFVLAALGLRSCLHFLRAGVDNPLPASLAVALALGIPAAGLTELARFHVNRTDAEVRLAREISRGGRSRVLVVEQLWRMGGDSTFTVLMRLLKPTRVC